MAAMASKKDSYGARPPPPPISQSTAPIQIYDVIEEHPGPEVRLRNHHHHHHQQQQNRNSVPPAPLAYDNEYIEPDDQDGEYVDAEYRRGGHKDIRSGPQDIYYQDAQDKRRSQDTYYLDMAAPPNRNSAYQGHGSPQDHYQGRYDSMPPSGPYSLETYEIPYDDEYYDRRGYPNDYQERKPVDRRESRKRMGVAIMAGLNTARVKEVKLRLRPAFGPDEVIDSMERRSQASSTGPTGDDPDPIDVTGLSIAARMKLLEAKQQKPTPPPTYPKSRPTKNLAAAAAGVQSHPPPPPPGTGSGVVVVGHGPAFGTDVPADGVAVDLRRHTVAADSPQSGSPRRSPIPSNRTSLDEAPWFFGNYDQHRCEEKLRNLNKEGAFIIRISKKGESRGQPFALYIFHENDIYHLMIRQKMNEKFAVGSEKPGEPEFGSLVDLVKFHADIPIEVVSKTEPGRATAVSLTMSPLK